MCYALLASRQEFPDPCADPVRAGTGRKGGGSGLLYVDDLAVFPRFHGQGVASGLLAAAASLEAITVNRRTRLSERKGPKKKPNSYAFRSNAELKAAFMGLLYAASARAQRSA